MLFAILCYNEQDVVLAFSKEQDDAIMADLARVEAKLTAQGKLGPVARLMPTTKAKTLRKEPAHFVVDGPFAETKEQILGFFVVDCASMDEALAVTRELADANPGTGAYEVRPLAVYHPGDFTPG